MEIIAGYKKETADMLQMEAKTVASNLQLTFEEMCPKLAVWYREQGWM